MNKDELVQQYGSSEAAAKAVATGEIELADGDFESFEAGFRDLILFEQGKAAQPSTDAKLPRRK